MQKKVVGVNQSLREVKKNNAQYVYIAKDADKDVIDELVKCCEEQNIEIKYIDTKKELGKMANVQVKVAALTILKEGGE